MGLREVILRDRPVGYWPCSERSGTVARDRSGYGRDGTFSATLGKPGPWSEPIAVDIVPTSYLEIADNAAFSPSTTGKFTVEMFALFDSVTAVAAAAGKGDSGGAGRWEWDLLFGTNGTLRFGTFNNDVSQSNVATSPSGFFVVNRWYHIVGTYDAAAVRQSLYANAERVATITSLPASPSDQSSAVRFGMRSLDQPMDGRIAHCAIYNHALSQAQILTHYRAARGFQDRGTRLRST